MAGSNDDLPRSPLVFSPVSQQLPLLYTAASGPPATISSGPQSAAAVILGRAASDGSRSMGGAKPGSAFAGAAVAATRSSCSAIASGSGTLPLALLQEDQVARLKRVSSMGWMGLGCHRGVYSTYHN